ncbi:MAG TPA: hypothetical protein VGH28_16550 [Polyangiaceae bacterium]
MPIEVSVDESAGMVLLRLTGAITFADFQRARADVQATPGWSAHYAHVLDFTQITALELSHDEVEKLASATPIFAPDALQVLVARSGSVHFGLSRMFEAYADGKRAVRVVATLEQAKAVVAEHRRTS